MSLSAVVVRRGKRLEQRLILTRIFMSFRQQVKRDFYLLFVQTWNCVRNVLDRQERERVR